MQSRKRCVSVVPSHLQALLASLYLQTAQIKQTLAMMEEVRTETSNDVLLPLPSSIHFCFCLHVCHWNSAACMDKPRAASTEMCHCWPDRWQQRAGTLMHFWRFKLTLLWSECDSTVEKVQPLPEGHRWTEEGESKNGMPFLPGTSQEKQEQTSFPP